MGNPVVYATNVDKLLWGPHGIYPQVHCDRPKRRVQEMLETKVLVALVKENKNLSV